MPLLLRIWAEHVVQTAEGENATKWEGKHLTFKDMISTLEIILYTTCDNEKIVQSPIANVLQVRFHRVSTIFTNQNTPFPGEN